jgi:molecular chaperone DnaJ
VADRDLYELLCVARDATDDELKRAFRRRARELHPDTNPDDPAAEAEFKQVSVAYEILSDPQRRQHYDRFGLQGIMGGQPGGPEWTTFGEGGLGDLFEAFFGAMGGAPRRGPSGPAPGPDAEVTLRLSLLDAAFGAEKSLEVRLPVACDACGATGAAPGTSPTTCPDCHGTGELRRVRQSILGQVVSSTGCPTCHATGATIASPCSTCHGEGRTTVASTLAVNVPAGVEDGSTMRLTGRGPAGFRGGGNGTLYVHLGVEQDARFERVGDDLHVVASVSIAQAALGTVATVATLEGDEAVDVDRGTQPGTVIRLRQRGVTHLRGRGRGDLLVHVDVQVPTELDEESETMLRSLAEHRKEPVAEPHTGGLFSRLRTRH